MLVINNILVKTKNTKNIVLIFNLKNDLIERTLLKFYSLLNHNVKIERDVGPCQAESTTWLIESTRERKATMARVLRLIRSQILLFTV